MPVFNFNDDDRDVVNVADENDACTTATSSGNNNNGIGDDDEVEPPHPLGFSPSPWGKTWFSLDPPPRFLLLNPNSGQSRYALDWSDDDDDEKGLQENISSTKYAQSYPPISLYVDPDVAPTSARLECHRELAAQHQRMKLQTFEPRRRQQRQLQQLQQQQQNRRRGRYGDNSYDYDDNQEEDLYYYSDDDDEDDGEGDDYEDSDQDGEYSVAMLKQLAHRNVQRRIQQDPQLLSPPGGVGGGGALLSAEDLMRKEQDAIQYRKMMDAKVQQKIQQNRQKVELELQENTRILGEIILETEQKAAAILKMKQREENLLRQQQEEKERQEQADRDKEEREVAEAEEARRNAVEAKQREEAKRKKDQEAAEAEASKKTLYISKAQHKVAQLIKLRASLESFETNKAMSKRRLGMKKIAKGKVNTLSENSDKIKEVAQLICTEITKIRNEDEQYKQGLDSGNPQITSDMTKGKRYFLDLLSSDALTRIQADSFNGIKGDGFPLAAMLTLVSTENPDLDGVFAAHVFTVCPTAIPTLPAPKKDAPEDEVMTALGMLKGKDGEFESFDKFLSRTENIITFMADVQSSLPESHKLMGGNEGAILWLERFLDMLPPPPTSPLPLLTASVLTAFLTGAGHMLANKHTDAFKKYLTVITNDIVTRLDEGPIGKPSALRLTKLVSGGFDYFHKELPPKALPELYFGASETSHRNVETLSFGGEIGGKQEERQLSSNALQPVHNPFGGSTSSTIQVGNPFGGGNTASSPSPFGGGGGVSKAPSSSPFGNPTSGSSPSPFGGGMTATVPSTQSPLVEMDPAVSTTPFGGTAATPIAQQAQAPFGNTSAAPSASPFGNAPAPRGQSPFGSAFGSNNAPSPSPFGTNSNTSQPFSSAPASTSPFGSAPMPATQATPFGNNSSLLGSSPFGSLGPQMSTPFASGAAPSSSPFGGGDGGSGISSSSPFGQSSTFGSVAAQSSSPFGSGGGSSGISSSSPFGQSSTFGNSNSGTSSAATSFGGFGGGSNNGNSFGSNRGGGSSSKKPPCKFFAKGQCRYGNNCKYSHDLSNTGSGGGTFGGGTGYNSGFGGPGSSSGGGAFGTSPFGTSTSSPFVSTSPFGGARR